MNGGFFFEVDDCYQHLDKAGDPLLKFIVHPCV